MQQYTGSRVAGFTPDQQSAFSAVQNAQGVQTPYINAATQYASQAATPTTNIPTVGTNGVDYSAYTPQSFNAADLAQYYDPYQQQVIDSTLANIQRNNAVQQNSLLGNAISSGASPFGGDRAGIAAAELARNQNLATNQTIADLASQGYNTALSAYQNQQAQQNQAGLANAANALTASQSNAGNTLAASQQNASNYLTNAQNNATRASTAAEQLAGLGTQAQNQALTGASALLQSGSLQQQLNQQQLDIPYQNFQEQQQYPLQMAQFLVNAINGNPTNLGSTQSTTQPTGNTLTGITGLLTALGGLFKDGGAVEPGEAGLGAIPGFDTGGSPSTFSLEDAPGYSGIAVPMLNADAFRYQGTPIDWASVETSGGGLAPLTSVPSYINALPQISLSAMPAPATYALPSGLLAALQAFPDLTKISTKKKADGGRAMGGIADFNDRWNYDTMPLGDIKPVLAAGIAPANIVPVEDTAVVRAQPPDPATDPSMPPPDKPDRSAVQADAAAAPPAPPAVAANSDLSGIATILSGSPEQADAYLASPRAAMLRAGLAMMASKSPNALQGIGEGALAGLDAYTKSRESAASLDAHPIVDDSGPTTRIYYPSEKKWVDTGIPTIKSQELDLKKAALAAGPDPTSLERNLIAAGLKPGTPEFQKAVLDATKPPSTNVAVNAGATETEKLFAKRYDDITTQANVAADANSKLDRMTQIASDPGFYSGPASGQVLLFKQGIAALGGDPNAAAPMEEFRALTNKAAIDSMGGSLGTGFSNADRDYVNNTVPSLDATVPGNLARAEVLRRINGRKIEIARMADDYVQENGHLDAGFNKLIRQYGEDHPLFADLAKTTGDAGTPPAGVSAKEWQAMTPEERKLWQN